MKHPNIMIGKQGYARRNRETGILNWKQLVKVFPAYREHIMRVRHDYTKLVGLRNKLVMKWQLSGNIVFKGEK